MPDQSAAPIAEALARYHERGTVGFTIPAHGGGRGPAPEFAGWMGPDVARADIPMNHGIDTRDEALGVQSTAQDLFAAATGAKHTMFSTGGSSQSARVAIMTVAGPGDTLLVARNGHKSAWAGLVFSGARPVYLDPVHDRELEIAHAPTPDTLAAALDAHPEARAAMVFSPSYYGTSADIAALAEVAHARGVPLVTDDAWGLDYAVSGHPDLPEGSLAQGADLAIGSVHKTLSGLLQTSVISVGSEERIDVERFFLCFELEQSTSASPLLLGSIDGARRQFVRDGEELLGHAVESAHRLRRRLADEVPELRVVSVEELHARPGVSAVDPTHVLIETAPVGLTGYQAADWLRDERRIEIEHMDHRRILPLITYAHDADDVDRLVRAVRDLVDAQGEPGTPTVVPPLPSLDELRLEQAMTPREAFFAPTEHVEGDRAVGRVSAELITPYPPGVPALAPGEVINRAMHDYLQAVVAAGALVEGTTDPTLSRYRVVA